MRIDRKIKRGALLVAMILTGPVMVNPADAEDYYTRKPVPQTSGDTTRPRNPGRTGRSNRSDVILPAIGLGISIIREINRQQRQEPVVMEPERPQRQRVVKPGRRAPPRRDEPRPRHFSPSRTVLPEMLRTARAKPRVYSIGDKPWASDRVFVVLLKSGMPDEAVADFLDRFDLEVIDQTRIDLVDQIALKVAYPEQMAPQDMLALMADERVFRVQLDYFYYPTGEGRPRETETYAELQYAFDKMGLSQLGDEVSGDGVRLAVIDSGIHEGHPALAESVSAYFTAFPEAGPDSLNEDHGTAVASIIAAHSGMRGVARDVSLMSAQVFRMNENGHMAADSYDIVRGIDWAVSNGARILNLSFAGAKDELLHNALSKAEERGVILIAAAGNEGADMPVAYPAAYGSVIAVTATDADDGLYVFANRGEKIELAAPGVDVLVAAGEDGFGLQSGTSMATAFISGSIALMLAREPDLDFGMIKERLSHSVHDLGEAGRDPDFGYGLLNAYEAVTGFSDHASVQHEPVLQSE